MKASQTLKRPQEQHKRANVGESKLGHDHDPSMHAFKTKPNSTDEKGREENGRMESERRPTSLEDKGGVLLLLVTTELKVLASLEGHVRTVFASSAL